MCSRHNGVHFFDIWTSKSGPRPPVFYTFDFEMCFAPQRRALFQHLDFQKCSEAEVFCTFWLRNVLRATTACTFLTSQLPKVVRDRQFFTLLTLKCASRHNGVQFFIAPVASWLRTRRFSEPTFRPSGATNHWKNTVFRDFPTFSRICIFCLLTLSLLIFSPNLSLPSASALLCFSSLHIVGSLTSKLPSIIQSNFLHIPFNYLFLFLFSTFLFFSFWRPRRRAVETSQSCSSRRRPWPRRKRGKIVKMSLRQCRLMCYNMLQYVQYNILHDVLFYIGTWGFVGFLLYFACWFRVSRYFPLARASRREEVTGEWPGSEGQRECCKVCSDHGVLSTTGSGSAQDQVAFSSHKDCSPNDRFFLKTSKAKTSVECKEDIQCNGWTEWTEAIWGKVRWQRLRQWL